MELAVKKIGRFSLPVTVLKLFFRKGKKLPNKDSNDKGFTIVELLVATTIFSSVLLILTLGVTRIAQEYVRGITESNTQNTARNIINDISQSIEFTNSTIGSPRPAGQLYYFCVGNRAYFYQLGNQVVSPGSPLGYLQDFHGLVAQDGDTLCPTPTDLSFFTSQQLPTSQQEFLSPNMRLAVLDVSPVPNSSDLYEVSVRVAYGDNNLLCNTAVVLSGTPSCRSKQTMTNPNDYTGPGVECRLGVGSQFCAVSSLNVYVKSGQ